MVATLNDPTGFQDVTPILHADFETVIAPGQVPMTGTEDQGGPRRVAHGIDGFRSAFGDWLSAWETWVVTPTDFIDVDESHVIVLLNIRARSKTHQVEMPVEGANLLTLSDGKLARLELFFGHEQALEAAGLAEAKD